MNSGKNKDLVPILSKRRSRVIYNRKAILLRNDFIARMKDIELDESIIVKDFEERYGLVV